VVASVPKRRKRQVEIGTVLESFDDFLRGDAQDKRFVVLYGGAGSGKSHAVAQRLVELAAGNDGLEIMALCKTGPQLRGTVYKFIKGVADQWGLDYELNRTHKEFGFGTSTIYCSALDDPDKAKSWNLTHAWMEEATNFTIEDFREINRRVRVTHELPNQIFLSFNPKDAFHWAVERFVSANPPPNAAVMHSTYMDNPYLDEAAAEELEALMHEDENAYRIYALGEPGVLEEGIYKNYKPLPGFLFPREDPDCYGLDVGDAAPTAMVAIWRDERKAYVRELLYQTRMSTGEILSWLKGHGVKPGVVIYIDPSEQRLEKEIRAAGFSVMDADNEVSGGINYVRSLELLVDEESYNLFKEISGYSYKRDAKTGRVFDQPVKHNDHLMDAMRYAIFTDGKALMESPVPDSHYGEHGSKELADAFFMERPGRRDPYWDDL